MDKTAEQIAAGLSPRMKQGLLTPPALKTFRTDHCCVPGNMNTSLALYQRGLIAGPWDVICGLTPLGLAVRAILQEQSNAD